MNLSDKNYINWAREALPTGSRQQCAEIIAECQSRGITLQKLLPIPLKDFHTPIKADKYSILVPRNGHKFPDAYPLDWLSVILIFHPENSAMNNNVKETDKEKHLLKRTDTWSADLQYQIPDSTILSNPCISSD